MLRKIFVILISICLFASLLIGCSNRSVDNNNPVAEDVTNEDNKNNEQDNSEDDGKEMYKDKYEVKWDCGRYIGQIDNNTIEIKIIGKPDSFDPEAFRLEEEFKKDFSKYNLIENDEIKFKYYMNEDEQKVIIHMEKY